MNSCLLHAPRAGPTHRCRGVSRSLIHAPGLRACLHLPSQIAGTVAPWTSETERVWKSHFAAYYLHDLEQPIKLRGPASSGIKGGMTKTATSYR